jgi:hypothetical protein
MSWDAILVISFNVKNLRIKALREVWPVGEAQDISGGVKNEADRHVITNEHEDLKPLK